MMNKLNIKQLTIIVVIIAILVFMHQAAYPLRYYYYLWKLKNAEVVWDVMDINEKIESIAPNVIRQLTMTYENIKAPDKYRRAAAIGLIKADKKKAEDLFIKYLSSNEDKIVAEAIFDLALSESDKPFNDVIKYSRSPNHKIRWSVTYYPGLFKREESLSELAYIWKYETDKDIRDLAAHELQVFGVNLTQ